MDIESFFYVLMAINSECNAIGALDLYRGLYSGQK